MLIKPNCLILVKIVIRGQLIMKRSSDCLRSSFGFCGFVFGRGTRNGGGRGRAGLRGVAGAAAGAGARAAVGRDKSRSRDKEYEKETNKDSYI